MFCKNPSKSLSYKFSFQAGNVSVASKKDEKSEKSEKSEKEKSEKESVEKTTKEEEEVTLKQNR